MGGPVERLEAVPAGGLEGCPEVGDSVLAVLEKMPTWTLEGLAVGRVFLHVLLLYSLFGSWSFCLDSYRLLFLELVYGLLSLLV